MQLIHTSPNPINEIHSNGRFGEFLFFSVNEEYVMTAGSHVTYHTDVSEDEIIRAERLFYHESAESLSPLVEQVMRMAGCDEDTAEELISQEIDIHSIDTDFEPEDLAEISWDIQRIAGHAAVLLGFRAVSMNDEQGRSYLVYRPELKAA